MIHVEVCINADDGPRLTDNARAAQVGGAATIELCAAMHLDGTTPAAEQVQAARRAFERSGLMVMIRPRGGDFVYNQSEVAIMLSQIADAARTGADGVVFGALRAGDNTLDPDVMLRLLDQAKRHGLQASVHRALDATPDPLESLLWVREAGFDRVLTSGTPWGCGGSAVDGLPVLREMVRLADGRLQIVIGGGVHPGNARQIASGLPSTTKPVSLHAYSGVQFAGRVAAELVERLCQQVNADYI